MIDMDQLTSNMQFCSDIALDFATDQFGLDCKLYYPDSSLQSPVMTAQDPEYYDTPNIEARLLIPDFYNLRRTPQGGVFDSLNADEFLCYVKQSIYIPYQTKIVVISEKLGTLQFISDSSDSITTQSDSIYRQVRLLPYLTFTNNDPDSNTSTKQLVDEFIQQNLDAKSTFDDLTVKSDPTAAQGTTFKFRSIE